MLVQRTRMRYIPGLDFLRVIALVGVVSYHILPHKVQGGFLGVCLFYMISGYLLFCTSEAEYRNGGFHPLKFYKKKFLKLFPPLFFMIMSVLACLTLFHREELVGIRQECFSIFLGYNNWWQISQDASYFTRISNNSPFTHLWFLSVEMQLYLLWPFVYALYRMIVRRGSKQRANYIFLILAILSAVMMGVLYSEENVTRSVLLIS